MVKGELIVIVKLECLYLFALVFFYSLNKESHLDLGSQPQYSHTSSILTLQERSPVDSKYQSIPSLIAISLSVS